LQVLKIKILNAAAKIGKKGFLGERRGVMSNLTAGTGCWLLVACCWLLVAGCWLGMHTAEELAKAGLTTIINNY